MNNTPKNNNPDQHQNRFINPIFETPDALQDDFFKGININGPEASGLAIPQIRNDNNMKGGDNKSELKSPRMNPSMGIVLF